MTTNQNLRPAHLDMLPTSLSVEISLSTGLSFIVAGLKGLGCTSLVLNIDRDILSLEFTEEAIEEFRSYTYSINVYLKYMDTMLCVDDTSRFYNAQVANLGKLAKLKNYFLANGVIIDIGPDLKNNFLASSQICAKLLLTSIEHYGLNTGKVFLRENERSKIGSSVLEIIDNTIYRLCHYSLKGNSIPESSLHSDNYNIGIVEAKKIIEVPETLSKFLENGMLNLCSSSLNDTLESIKRLKKYAVVE